MAHGEAAPRWLVAGPIALAILVARPAFAESVLVEFQTGTLYRANGSDPGIGLSLTAEASGDAAWGQGTYGIDYATAPPGAVSLLRTTVPSNTLFVSARARFRIDNPGEIGHLWFGAEYDDGYVAWINGVEVARSSAIPSGTPSGTTVAASQESSNAAVPDYGALIPASMERPASTRCASWHATDLVPTSPSGTSSHACAPPAAPPTSTRTEVQTELHGGRKLVD